MTNGSIKKIFNKNTLYLLLSFFAGYFFCIFLNSNIYRIKNNEYVDDYNYESDGKNDFINKSVSHIKSKTLEGKEWSIRDFNGEVVLLYFWSISCPPCLDMMDDLKILYEEYKENDNLVIYGVPLIHDQDVISCYIKTKSIPWPQLYIGMYERRNSIIEIFNIHTSPSVWLIDKNGKINSSDLRSINIIKKKLKEIL